MLDDAIQSPSSTGSQSMAIVQERLKKIPLMNPTMDVEMQQAALEALQNEKFVLGPSVYKFEEEFAKFCGTRNAISTGSGTAALQIAIQALGVKADEGVLTTPFSFFATSNAVIHAGARPEFADVDPSFNLSSTMAGERVTRDTKAVLPVHLYGNPCQMDEFVDLAEDKQVSLIEDACQAHGAEYDGKKVGSFGDAGCFSFYPSKNMTVGGDGGMIVTNNDKVAEVARSLRDCGRETKYTMSRIGFTSRLNSVNAAIGRVQLRKLPEWNEARRRAAAVYRQELDGVEGVVLPPASIGTTPVYHLFVIRSKARDQIATTLSRKGVETGIHYPVPIHLQTPYRRMFGYSEGAFPQSEKLAGEVLSLPIYPGITEQDIRYITSVVKEAVVVS
jgi:perosamine synthetase